jgi:hypothetical protein
MYALPHALTGLGTLCGIFKGYACNGYGRDCLGYKPHTKESLAVLNEVIEEMKSKERSANNAD